MGSPVSLRDDFDAEVLRFLAKRTRDANQGRRWLCQIKILGIFQSPYSCRKSQVFCAFHGQPRITFST